MATLEKNAVVTLVNGNGKPVEVAYEEGMTMLDVMKSAGVQYNRSNSYSASSGGKYVGNIDPAKYSVKPGDQLVIATPNRAG